MNEKDLHPSVKALAAFKRPLTDTDFDMIEAAVPLVDDLPAGLSADDITVLLKLLPETGDTASGVNWTILHRIEASPDWPLWDLIAEPDHEWHMILRTRLKYGGYEPPRRSLWQRLSRR